MDTSANFRKFTLPNGLTVFLYKMDGVMSASAILFVRTGAIFEKEEDRGISHLIEHSAFVGTKKFPSSSEVSNFAENLGILYNGGTSKDNTSYTLKSPSINFSKGLEMLAEFVFNPILDEQQVLKEKEIILSEFNDFWNDPIRRFDHVMFEKRFARPNHPYARRPMGVPETIKNLSLRKVAEYRSKFYNPTNMVLSIAGNFDENIENTVKDLFGIQGKGGVSEEPKFNPNDYSDFVLYNQEDKRPQISFNINFPAFGWLEADKRERTKLGLLSTILGSARSSRLFSRLREKDKLVYKITSGWGLLAWLGSLSINGSVSSEKLVQTVDTIKEEIENLIKNGVKENELELSKNFTIAQVMMQFDNPGVIARYFGEQTFYDEELWSPERRIEEIQKITKADLDVLASKIFNFTKVNIGFLGDVPKAIVNEVEKVFKK